MHYRQRYASTQDASSTSDGVITLQSLPPDLAFNDGTLDNVRLAWQRITDGDLEAFLKFEAREGTMEDDDST